MMNLDIKEYNKLEVFAHSRGPVPFRFGYLIRNSQVSRVGFLLRGGKMTNKLIIQMSIDELKKEKVYLEEMIDEGCYGVADYDYYMLILKELTKRKGI